MRDRHYSQPSAARFYGALLAIFALVLQISTFAFHGIAQGASLDPFHEPSAWCLSGSAGQMPADPSDETPLKTAVVCPVCQSAELLGAALVPPVTAVATPAWVADVEPVQADIDAPRSVALLPAQARAPPLTI